MSKELYIEFKQAFLSLNSVNQEYALAVLRSLQFAQEHMDRKTKPPEKKEKELRMSENT